MLAKHAWIAAERAFFGKPHTDYDFTARDPKEASARLTALEKQQAELERKINKKVRTALCSVVDLIARRQHLCR
jgi:structural maintenance of chromosome 2